MHFGASVLVLLQGAAARCVAMCALELGRSCCCKVLLPDVWPCARWSLGAGVAALVLEKKSNNAGIYHTEDTIYHELTKTSSALCETMGTLKNDTMTLPQIHR